MYGMVSCTVLFVGGRCCTVMEGGLRCWNRLSGRSSTTIDEKEHGLSGWSVFERDGNECEWNSMVDDTHE